MFIQETLEVINAFLERFVPLSNEQGDYTQITTMDGKVRFTFNDDYHLFAWIEADELHIECGGESEFDYAKEHGWTDEQVRYVKYGRR